MLFNRVNGKSQIMSVKQFTAVLILALLSIWSYSHAEDLGFDEIIFVKRMPYSSDHYYTDINNGTRPDRFLPGNGIFIYNIRTRS